MIEIKIPKDIREFSEKLFLGLSLRQLIATIASAAIGVGVYFICRGTFMEEWAFIPIVIPIAPLAVWGFVRPQGMPAEQYLKNVIETMMVKPERRYYRTDNYYERLTREVEQEKAEQNKQTFSAVPKTK